MYIDRLISHTTKSVTDLRYRYMKCIPDDCVKHETNSRILHVSLISVT